MGLMTSITSNKIVDGTGEKFYALPKRGQAIVITMVLFAALLLGGYVIHRVSSYFGNKAHAVQQSVYEKKVADANTEAARAAAEVLRLNGVVDAKNEELKNKDAEIAASNERLAETAIAVSERSKTYEKTRTNTRPTFRGTTTSERTRELDADADELYPNRND